MAISKWNKTGYDPDSLIFRLNLITLTLTISSFTYAYFHHFCMGSIPFYRLKIKGTLVANVCTREAESFCKINFESCFLTLSLKHMKKNDKYYVFRAKTKEA